MSNSVGRSAVLDYSAVVIGGSAGCLDALLFLLKQLAADFPLPIIVVVHSAAKGPPKGLSSAIATRCVLPVREPEDKDPIVSGGVFVAPPGYHLLIETGPSFAFSLDDPERYARPSIDALFESASEVFGDRLIGVILSGANDDGALGLAAVSRAGGLAIVHSPEAAPSPEMPRAALAACPNAKSLPLQSILERLVSISTPIIAGSNK